VNGRHQILVIPRPAARAGSPPGGDVRL